MIIVPILEIKTLRFREVRRLAYCSQGSKLQNQHFNLLFSPLSLLKTAWSDCELPGAEALSLPSLWDLAWPAVNLSRALGHGLGAAQEPLPWWSPQSPPQD